MIKNTRVHYHGNQVINTLDKIIILLTKSTISKQDKDDLIRLDQLHYHFGLIEDYFRSKLF